jgi:WD40 repeat protein
VPAFDHFLIDPPEAALTSALTAAGKATGPRRQWGRTEPPRWPQLLAAGFREQAEGVRCWAPTMSRPQPLPIQAGPLVVVAWWTDPLGRRHVRVAGRRPWDEAAMPLGPPGEERPPLWLIEPDRLFLRTLPGRPRHLLAACACGAVGEPAALGWVGDCCGICHDRCEDGAAPVERLDARPLSLLGLLGEPGMACGVGWTADGRGLVVARCLGQDGTVLEFWERETGQVRQKHAISLDRPEVSFGCDGRLAATCGGGRVVFWDAATGAEVFAQERQWRSWGASGPFLYRGTDGRALIAGRTFDSLTLEQRTGWRSVTVLEEGEGYCRALSPDGRLLASGRVSGPGVILRDLRRAARASVLPLEPSAGLPGALAFSSDGLLLAVGLVPAVRSEGEPPAWCPGAVLLFDVAAGTVRERLPPHPGGAFAVAFTPDGRWLLSAGADRRLRFWEVEKGREAALLEWHAGAVRCLAFSADGELLASGAADGVVRLWPWRRLLAASALRDGGEETCPSAAGCLR